MAEYLLEMRGITKEFNGVKAIQDIGLKVKAGEVVGLCGENGAGKSTLMKVLSAVYPYGSWDGQIIFEGKELKARSIRETEDVGIAIIHQELMLVPHLSVAENIFLGSELTTGFGLVDYEEMNARAAALMRRLKMPDINVALPVWTYSGGKQQLIEIAKALNKNAKLLILDEPTSALTTTETETLLELIREFKAQGMACVYISHKLEEVAAIADTVTVIRDGQHIATGPMRDLDTNKIITMMVGREMKNLFPREEHAIGEVVFEAKNISCWDPNSGRKVVDDVSFELRAGEIVGVAGLVGAGRTELGCKLFGYWRGDHEGRIILEGKEIKVRSPSDAVRQGICMVPEDRKRHGIVPLMGVGYNMTLSVLGRFAHSQLINAEDELAVIQAEILRMKVKTAHPLLPIASLSGGNQQKAVVGKMLLPEPKVLILDEPTHGVDVGAKYEIYKLIFELAKQGVAILMISSEMPEVLGVSDRVLVMGEGKLKGNFANVGLSQEKVLAAALGAAETAAA